MTAEHAHASAHSFWTSSFPSFGISTDHPIKLGSMSAGLHHLLKSPAINPGDTGTSGIMSQLEMTLTTIRQRDVLIPDPADIRRYLLEHLDLMSLLDKMTAAVCPAAWTIPVQVSLEVYHDPEITDEYLTLYVRPYHYESGFLGKIEDFSAPFEQDFVHASAYIVITTDFRPPR